MTSVIQRLVLYLPCVPDMFSTGMYCARYVQPHAGLLLNFLGLCANYSIKDLRTLRNKSSAVAEMGDCARAKWAEKGGGLLCPFLWEELSPHLTQCRLPPYQVAS